MFEQIHDAQQILDTVEKREEFAASTKWNRSDVQQAAMFATGYRATAAFIATFSCEAKVTDISMSLGLLEIKRFNWNAHLDVAPVDAENDFLRRIKHFVVSHEFPGTADSRVSLSQIGYGESLVP